MSIADKITSIETHLEADYEGLENIGADLTGINKNILNIRTILDNIYNDMPKVTGEGTEVTLTPTRKGRLALIPKGNSTQESTTGKNILGLPNKSTDTTQGITYSTNNGIITLSGTANGTAIIDLLLINPIQASLGTLTKSLNPTGTYLGIQTSLRGQDANTSVGLWSSDAINRTETISANAYNLRIQINNGVSVNCTLKAQVEIGSSATSFEQYTNGPAPNPSYPFPIKSVTGNNNVVVHNNNFLDNTIYNTIDRNGSATLQPNGYYLVNFPVSKTIMEGEFEENTQYAMSCIGYGNTSGNNGVLKFNYTDNTSSAQGISGTTPNSFSLISTAGKTIKNIEFTFGSGYPTYIKDLMLEKNSVVTPYVAHQEVTKPLNLGTIELNKIGNYQDYIFKQNDKWYKHEEIGKVVLNGTEDWTMVSLTGLKSMRTALPSATKKYQADSVGLSNMATCQFIDQLNKFYFSTNLQLVIDVDNTYTLDTWKSYLGNNNLEIRYVLNTETDIEITDTTLISQLEEIDKMKSYEGTTIITSTFDSNNAQMIISASGLKGE